MQLHCISVYHMHKKLTYCSKLTLFSLVSGFNHFGRKCAASISRNCPSLSSNLMISKSNHLTCADDPSIVHLMRCQKLYGLILFRLNIHSCHS